MDLSVIICTYNRAESLKQTLATCCGLAVPPNRQWELLVMDNNSTDATRRICDEFNDKLPLRYIFESRQGKSYALNRGIAEARGALLLFTDDDVDLDQYWLAQVWDASERHATALYFGGKVIPRWEKPPPRWLAQNSSTILRAMTVHLDFGEAERALIANEMFLGANLAFRKQAFAGGVKFREDIGPNKFDQTRGEETDLINRLRTIGAAGIYVPTAVVHHRNGADRMTEKYLREWYRGSGVTAARTDPLPQMNLWFSAPRYIWRQLLSESAKYAVFRWTAPAPVWIQAESAMARNWGVIQECRRQARGPK